MQINQASRFNIPKHVKQHKYDIYVVSIGFVWLHTYGNMAIYSQQV